LVDVSGEGLAVGAGDDEGDAVGEPDGAGVVLGEGLAVCGCWLSTYTEAPTNTTIAIIATAKYKTLTNYLDLPN
jgi:hypothetical protein